jgi:hypothetical protein
MPTDWHRSPKSSEERGILAAVVGMVNDAVSRSPVPDRHLQRADHQFRPQMIRHGPAHDPATEHIKNDGEVEEPLPPRRHVRDIGDPERIGGCRREQALHQIRGRLGGRIAPRRVEWAPAMTPHQADAAHEARDALVSTTGPGRHELRMHAWHAIGTTARLVDRADLLG